MKIWLKKGLFCTFIINLLIILSGCAGLQSKSNQASNHSKEVLVGTVWESHNTRTLKTGKEFTTRFSHLEQGDYFLLRIVIPNDLMNHTYDFELFADNQKFHQRSGKTSGYGRRSFFILFPSIPHNPDKKISVRILNHAKEPLYIESFECLPKFSQTLKNYSPDTQDFTLAFLVNDAEPDSPLFSQLSEITDSPYLQKAFSTEIYYANQTGAQLQNTLENIKLSSEKYHLPVIPTPSSWWAGTPYEVLHRLDFQQICWSESDDYDEGPELKKLLGDQWDIHYGLTSPNIWSNTPWQTLNNPELNLLRQSRMHDAVNQMESTLKNNMLAYISENEPAYWAGDFPDWNYPVKRKNLLADFNPYTIAKAKSQGVTLDPKNGLDLNERTWLFHDLAEYNQSNISTLNSAGASVPVYSHALLTQHFPFEGTNLYHPYAEVARVHNARVGVEMLWQTPIQDLWRIREWGHWANVNREENDGLTMPFHIATLQACYMMGADLVNSYNWNTINKNNEAIGYFNDFLFRLEPGDSIVSAQHFAGVFWLPLESKEETLSLSSSFPWANQIQLHLQSTDSSNPLHIWLTDTNEKNILAYRILYPKDLAKLHAPTIIDFGDITLLNQGSSATLHLQTDGEWEIRGEAIFPNYQLLCDLFQERARSRFLISHIQ